MHILDTDTLTRLHAGHSKVAENLRKVEDAEIVTTIVTKIELLRGRFEFQMKAADGEALLQAQRWLAHTETLLSELVIIPFDPASAKVFDRLRVTPGLRKIGRADMLIASIALARQAVLVTRNLWHFKRVPNLVVVNWID